MAVVDHVPDHAVGNRRIDRPFHSDRDRAASRERAAGPPGDSRQAEVVAEDRNPSAPDIADQLFQILQLLLLFGPVEQHIVPVRGVEILECFQL